MKKYNFKCPYCRKGQMVEFPKYFSSIYKICDKCLSDYNVSINIDDLYIGKIKWKQITYTTSFSNKED